MMQSTDQLTHSRIENHFESCPLRTGLPSLDHILPLRPGALHFIQVIAFSKSINIFVVFYNFIFILFDEFY
jgi:hypothetical protein